MNTCSSSTGNSQAVFTTVLNVWISSHLKAHFTVPYGCNTNYFSLQMNPRRNWQQKEQWVYYHCTAAKSAVPLFFTLAHFSSPAGYEPVPWHTSNIYCITNAYPPAHSSRYHSFLPLRDLQMGVVIKLPQNYSWMFGTATRCKVSSEK